MRRLLFLLVLGLLVGSFFCLSPVRAQGEVPWIDLTPYSDGHLPPGTIEIPPDDVETFFAHISWPGHEGEELHIAEVSWHWQAEPAEGANSWVEQWLVQPSQLVRVSEWFPWNVVHTVGRPSTLIAFQSDVMFHDAQGLPHGPIWSNVVYKHITPEPSTLAAFGMGAASLGGLLWRRRRK